MGKAREGGEEGDEELGGVGNLATTVIERAPRIGCRPREAAGSRKWDVYLMVITCLSPGQKTRKIEIAHVSCIDGRAISLQYPS